MHKYQFVQMFLMTSILCASFSVKAANLEQLTPAEQKIYLDGKYETVDRVIAPTMAWLLGFGTGQAKLGVYADRGWYFTVADSVGFVMMITGLFSCEAKSNCTPAASGTIGTGIFVGSRIWQFVDAITYPNAQNDQYELIKQKLQKLDKPKNKVSFFVAPINQGAALGLSARF